jgi:hypothetical protein
MTITLKIEGEKAEITQFSLPEMSLSSARSVMDRKQFQIEIKSADLLRLLSKHYYHWVVESKEDDEQCGSPQDSLARAGYPELSDVLNNNELLNLVVGSYLFEELIGCFSKSNANIKYWWDEVVSCSYIAETVFIDGVCYSKKGT